MSSPERMQALLAGERPDRVPVIPFIFGHTALVCGQPLARVFDDAEQSFRCQVLCQEMYGYDGGPLYAYASAGGWEFGGEIEFPHKRYSGAPVVTRHPIRTVDDALSLEAPVDVPAAGALPIALGVARLQAEHDMPVTLQIGSPFTWAGSVIGEDQMLVWMLKAPEAVHAVLRRVSEFVVAVAEHYAAEFGAERLMAFHGAATESNKLISPKQFETFVLPYYQEVNRRVMDLGISTMFIHICGEQNRNIEHWKKVPMPEHTILSFGREVALEKAVESFPDQIIAGNVDPTLIQEGRPEEVLAQARECVETAREHPAGYVLMAGCDVPPLAPPVNVFQLVKAAREYGRYR